MKLPRVFQFIAIALILFGADAILKTYVHVYIPVMSASTPIYPYGGIAVFQDWHGIDFSIIHVNNKGAAWGMFASIQSYLLYARVMIIGGLLTYLFFFKSDPYRKFCLMLICTGAIGNVIDYFVYGHVIDMFYFTFWGFSYPIFNIADSSIFCGIALLLIQSFFSKRKKQTVGKEA